MKDSFNAPAGGEPFVDTHFFFRGNRFNLLSYNDAEGKISEIKLEALSQPPALVFSIEREAALISQGLRMGGTLKNLMDSYAPGNGDVLYSVREEGGKQRLANNLWSAALQILDSKYENEGVLPPVPRRPSFLRVIDGGMA